MNDKTTTIPDQPDGIEDDSYDLPELGRAAERVREYICANGDGVYDVIDGHPLYARDMEALRRAGFKVAELTAALAERDTQLTAANRRADGAEADRDSLRKGHTAYANENARLRSQLAEADGVIGSMRAVIDAARSWRQMRRDWQTTPSQDSEALIDAVDALPKSEVAR